MPIVNNIRAEFIPVNFEKPATLKQKTIQANGVYNASDDNADGFSSVTVVVPKPAPNIQELNITPSTEPQTITVPGTIDGYGPVNVSGVENVSSENIKEGVSILGIQGSVVELNGETVNITPTTNEQVIEPTAPKNAITRATVSPVTSSIDSNIQPENIVKGKTILGVQGEWAGPRKTVSRDGVLGPDVVSAHILDLTGVTVIGKYQLCEAYYGSQRLTGEVDLSMITRMDDQACSRAFYNCRNITHVDISSLRIFGTYSCYNMFSACTGIQSVNFGSLESISGISCCQEMFYGCTGITDVTFSALKMVYGGCLRSMFYGCTGIQTVNMPLLTVLDGGYSCASMFEKCSSIQSIDLSSLKTLYANTTCQLMFASCTSLTNVSLPSLSVIGGALQCEGMFSQCTNLSKLSFPAITTSSFISGRDHFRNMCSGASNVTLHFPSNVRSVIEGLTGYSETAPFGATAGQVLFDLPATVILTGANTTEYQRSPKDDTQTALAWRVKDGGTISAPVIDWTPFYTNGTTDPQVGDTLYSDAECTTAVTTIDSIA